MTRIKYIAAAAALSVGAAAGIPFTGTAFAQADKQAKQVDQSGAQTASASNKGGAAAQRGSTTRPAAFLLVVPIPMDRVEPAVIPYRSALAPDSEAIRDTLASATEAAIAEDGFDDFVERLVDADRNRIGKFDGGNDSALDAAARRVRETWKNKFGDDLDIENEQAIYSSFPIVQGVINTALEPAVKSMPANSSGDYNLEPGRDIAVVTLPAGHGLRETTLVMIDEAFGWKIDVPNTVGGRDVHANLIQRLNAVADAADKWPANREAAARYLTHQVMLAAVDEEQQTAATAKK